MSVRPSNAEAVRDLAKQSPKVHRMMKIIEADDAARVREWQPRLNDIARAYNIPPSMAPLVCMRKHWIFVPTSDGQTLFEGPVNSKGVRTSVGTLALAFRSFGCAIVSLDPRVGASTKGAPAIKTGNENRADALVRGLAMLAGLLEMDEGAAISKDMSRTVCSVLGGRPNPDMRSHKCTWAKTVAGKMPDSRRNKAALQAYLSAIHHPEGPDYNYRRAMMYTNAVASGSQKSADASSRKSTIASFLRKAVFQHYLNADGLIVRFIAGDNSRATGLSMYFMRYVHVLSLPKSESVDVQAGKRAARSCGDTQPGMMSECMTNPSVNPGGPHDLCNTRNSIVRKLHYVYPDTYHKLKVFEDEAMRTRALTGTLAEHAEDCVDFAVMHSTGDAPLILRRGQMGMCLNAHTTRGGAKTSTNVVIPAQHAAFPVLAMEHKLHVQMPEIVRCFLRPGQCNLVGWKDTPITRAEQLITRLLENPVDHVVRVIKPADGTDATRLTSFFDFGHYTNALVQMLLPSVRSGSRNSKMSAGQYPANALVEGVRVATHNFVQHTMMYIQSVARKTIVGTYTRHHPAEPHNGQANAHVDYMFVLCKGFVEHIGASTYNPLRTAPVPRYEKAMAKDIANIIHSERPAEYRLAPHVGMLLSILVSHYHPTPASERSTSNNSGGAAMSFVNSTTNAVVGGANARANVNTRPGVDRTVPAIPSTGASRRNRAGVTPPSGQSTSNNIRRRNRRSGNTPEYTPRYRSK